MNAKQYIEEMRERYETPKHWAIQQRCDHFQAVEDGDIEKHDELFLEYLKDCYTWEDAENIAKIWIIG